MSEEDQARSRGVSRDMSAEAILRRLEIASELYELARGLQQAEFVGRVEQDGEEAGEKRE